MGDFDGGLLGACEGGHAKVAERMIARGASQIDEGLYWACEQGHAMVVQLLLECGARTDNLTSVNGLATLFRALSKLHFTTDHQVNCKLWKVVSEFACER